MIRNLRFGSFRKDDNHIVPKRTIVGAFGGGNVVEHDPGTKDAAPFTLPSGDKSMVQIVHGSEDDAKN